MFARLFDRFDKINHRLRFHHTICIDGSSPLNCTLYLSLNLVEYCCNSRKHLCKAFLRTFQIMYCTIVKEMRGREIFDLPGQTSQQPLDPFSSNSVVQPNGGVLKLFSRFRRGTENRGFIRIQKFLRRSTSNNKYICLSEEKCWGLAAL